MNVRCPGPTILIVCLIASAGAACATGKDHGRTAENQQQEKVRKDYLGYWDAVLAASATSDPNSPDLAAHAAGQQLVTFRETLTSAREHGTVAKGTVQHSIKRVTVDGSLAHVVDCVNVRQWLRYDGATGTAVPGQLIERPNQLGQFTLAPRNDLWLVTDVRDLGTC